MKKMTTIWISKETKEKLDKLGKFGESYNDILKRLLKKEENQ
jgi:predicted CopG family antitoxin